MEQERIFITTEECAKIFGVGRNTMLRIQKLPKFPAIFLAGRTLIYKNKLEPWAEKYLGFREKEQM